MKNTRKTHLWIGLIASIFIFMESITGLLINEPWLIGQTSMEGGRANFQQGQMNQSQFNNGQTNQGQARQGMTQNSGQTSGQPQGQNGNQNQNFNHNGQFQGRRNFSGNGNFPAGMMMNRGGMGQTSVMGIIRGLHEGRIGNTNIKWLIDLVALAMIALTGTGIYLSIKVLGAEAKRKKRQTDMFSDI
ncbi:PepSY domain-containing protein [Neobacillus drentensis]|uniref:PepSY-associated TM helix domain-containing protein n=1 Tax=Neobacillus drentensis TaxID=220684 RepID=UPI001F40CD78|nr:PepSY-associated TM helix domain-containing protein [Neobacillus drentensis]ULT59092.1 PepSY domain-containing protein [Neobacillus drentensis]